MLSAPPDSSDMSDDHWEEAKRLLDELIDADPDDACVWLDDRCDDPDLRAEVERLRDAYRDGTLSADDEAAGWLGDGAGAALEVGGTDAASLQGRRVGPYRLVEEIGLGGMSVVYRAERAHGEFEQTVAVKLLQRRLHSGGAEQRFRAERQVLASLDHPHIARLLDGGVTEGGRPYLVMEHVDGLPITEYADDHDLSVEKRLELLKQVLGAVEAAHRQLVVHRDLKPSNVFVTETDEGPRVKLLDFGIAKLLDDSMPVTHPETKTGHHRMTPAYAAPEQVCGDEITTATDVYQLGVLAYELLAGTRPFDLSGKSLTEIERTILEAEPPAPSTAAREGSGRAADLRGDLDTIVQTALRKEPGRRYASVEALAADLERHRAGTPVEARPATLRYRARKFVTRNATGVGVAAAFAALIAVAGALLVQQRNRARANAERAQENARRAQREAATAREVTGFLVDLFRASDPYQTGETVTARDLLRRGQRRADRLDDQPAVQARMLGAMGQAYEGRGNVEMADSLLKAALAIHRRREASPSALARSYDRLGEAALSDYDYEAALRYARKARSTAARHRPLRSASDSLLWASILHTLAEARENTGAPDSAETLARRALAIRTSVHSPKHSSVWETRRTLASILREREQFARGRRLYRDILAWERRQGDSLEVAQTLNDLGFLLRSRGALARATRRYREALRLYEARLGPAHATTLVARGNNLSGVLRMQNKYAAAEAALREQLRAVRDRYAPDHWRVGKWAGSLGEVLLTRGRHLAEAEALLRERVRIYEALGYSDVTMAEARAPLGRCLAERGKFRRARPLLASSHEVLAADTVQNADAADRAHAEVGLGLSQLYRERYARAESLLKAAHATLDSFYHDLPGVEAPLQPVRRVERHLADLYEAWGKPKRAQRYRVAEGTGRSTSDR